jgi:hypothetical protein
MTKIQTWIPISAGHLQKLLAWGNGQHHVESFGASIYTMSYVFSPLFFGVVLFPIDQKGNSGLSGFNFGPSQFQNLLYLAGYDPSQPPFTKPCGSGTKCVLPYMGHVRNSPSLDRSRLTLVLLMNLPPSFSLYFFCYA